MNHETTDMHPRDAAWLGGILCGLVLVASVGMWLLFVYYAKHQPVSPPLSDLERVRETPPEPRLQVREQLDLKQKRRSEDAILNSYGWVNRQGGVVRIPIDRAMDLLLQHPLPARSESAPGEQEKK